MKVPIRRPFIDTRRGPPYPLSQYNYEISRQAAIPGTPQHKYVHGIGIRYKALRLWDNLIRVIRGRSTLFWFVVFSLIFLAKYLSISVYSDFASQQARAIENAPAPTEALHRQMMDLNKRR